MNLIYIAENMASAIIYRSSWSATVAVYYALFIVTRIYILSGREFEAGVKDESSRVYKICFRVGLFLLLLDLSCAGMMFYTVRFGRVIYYSGYMLLGFLIYTVYSLTNSLVGLVKSEKNKSPLTYAARNMTLAASLMSVYNLQYSVLITLGAGSYFIEVANYIGGVLIFLTIILLAMRLIIRARASFI